MAKRDTYPKTALDTKRHAKPSLSRRAFAAAAGAAALSATLAGCTQDEEELSSGMPEEGQVEGQEGQEGANVAQAKDSVALAQKEELEKFVVTSGYNCCYCTIQGYKRDGKIVYIEPGELPEDPARNHACQRCMAWSQHATDENARVMYPMRRKEGTERGAGEWERLSWDEAIDYVAEKLNAVIAKDPKNASFYIFTGNMNMLSWFSPARMAHCIGASTWSMEGIMGDHATSVGYTMVTGNPDPGHDALDYENSNLMLFFGCNMADNIAPSIRFAARAKEKGAKLIVVDPRVSSTASIADEWIPINPGTDTAMILAMMNTIIANGLHDETWLKNYSCAPLLVSDEDGSYLRNADDKYLAWDTEKNEAVVAEPSQGKDDNTSGPESTLALTGRFEVDGVACHPAFDDLVAEVEKWTCERASKITGVPADRIESLALEYAKAQPAAIQTCTGSSRYYYGYEITRAAATMAGLCGYTGRAGGGASRNNGGNPIDGTAVDFTGTGAALVDDAEYFTVGDGESFRTFAGGILAPYATNPEGFKAARVFKSSEIYDAALTGNPVPIDFLYIATSNFINQSPDAHKVIDEVFPAIDFIVTADPFMTWTAQYSDVVLPVATWLETWDYSTQGAYLRVNKPIIERVGEAKSDTEIMTMLAKKVGCEKAWDKTDEEWIRVHLDSGSPALEGLSVDDMIEAGVIARKDGVFGKATYPLGDKVFSTPTGRLEFYTEGLVPFGAQVPTYMRGDDNPENKFADKYPLNFIQYHDRRQVHTQHSDTPLLDLLESEPHLYMNPEDADSRGIAHDDMVRLFNDRGSVTVKAFVTPGVIKGTVAMPQGWQPKDFADGHYQFLTHYEKNEVEEFLSMTNAAFYDVRAEVEKA